MEASQSGTDQPGQDAPISQQTPTEPSGLQTPQPDQPFPTGEEQKQAHEDREVEQDRARAEHNARTDGGETQEGARKTLRDEHLERTAESTDQPAEDAPADGGDED